MPARKPMSEFRVGASQVRTFKIMARMSAPEVMTIDDIAIELGLWTRSDVLRTGLTVLIELIQAGEGLGAPNHLRVRTAVDALRRLAAEKAAERVASLTRGADRQSPEPATADDSTSNF